MESRKELSDVYVSTLFERRDILKKTLNSTKNEIKELDEKLSGIYLSIAKGSLSDDGKDFGTTYSVNGNQKVKLHLAKKVTWDQDMLRETLETMSDEDARHYGKLTFAVEERKFTAAPPAIKRILEECRTIENGRFTVELEES